MPPNEFEVGNEETTYICCDCDPDPEQDQNTIVLFNMECEIHGHAWHRQMLKLGDGTLEATFALEKRATRKQQERETGSSQVQSGRQKHSSG
jgi:hypothetical protein